VVVFVGLLIATYRRFPLSDVSYMLIALYMTLHSIGAHYTYAQVPLGLWVKKYSTRPAITTTAWCTFHLASCWPIRPRDFPARRQR